MTNHENNKSVTTNATNARSVGSVGIAGVVGLLGGCSMEVISCRLGCLFWVGHWGVRRLARQGGRLGHKGGRGGGRLFVMCLRMASGMNHLFNRNGPFIFQSTHSPSARTFLHGTLKRYQKLIYGDLTDPPDQHQPPMTHGLKHGPGSQRAG